MLIPYQACRAAEGWFPVRVPSSSNNGVYTVFVSPWTVHESICECQGYQFRGVCKHQEVAAKRRCRWTELSDPQQQTDDERKMRICPRCGGSTRWEVDVVDDD